MTSRTRWRGGALVLALAMGCLAPDSDEGLVIVDVTVIPGDGPAIPNARVTIRDGRIAAIDTGGAGVASPAGVRTIDGRGRYLTPGLFEMHAHSSKTRASAFGLYLYHGVTTIRDLGGDHAELLRWRREIRSGVRAGPRMLIAGPYLESASTVLRVRNTPPGEMVEPVERTRIPVGSAEDADRVVDSLARLELDFLKVRTVASAEVFAALNAAAARNGLKLVGHTMGRSPEDIVAVRHDGVEHFILPRLADQTANQRMAAWRAFADSNIIVVPTLVTFTEHAFPDRAFLQSIVDDSAGRIDPRRRYISRYLVLDWAEQALEATADRQAFFKGQWATELQYLREMHQAGVTILAGSDVAAINIFPGSSLIDELVLLQDSVGLTPAEVMARATALAADFLGIGDSVGTVAVGRTADLILLDANPLENIANVRRIVGVIVGGQLRLRDQLEALLDSVRMAPDLLVNDWPRTGWQPPARP